MQEPAYKIFMADLAELLMVEHVAIRHISRSLEKDFKLEDFEAFQRYLGECHIIIEEKLLVPALEQFDWADSDSFTRETERIMADHRLLKTLAGNLISWHEKDQKETFAVRLPLYIELLSGHNYREELSVFPRWRHISADEKSDVLKEARDLILDFGKEDYHRITGISDKGFEYLFRD